MMIDGKGRKQTTADCPVGGSSGLNLLVGNVDTRMKVRSLRIYSRTLADDEQLWNYAVDRARFEGNFGEKVRSPSRRRLDVLYRMV